MTVGTRGRLPSCGRAGLSCCAWSPAFSPLRASIPDASAPCGCCALRLPTQPGGPAAHVGARRAAVPWACERSRRTPFSLYGSKRAEELDMATGLQVVFITPDTVDSSHELSTARLPNLVRAAVLSGRRALFAIVLAGAYSPSFPWAGDHSRKSVTQHLANAPCRFSLARTVVGRFNFACTRRGNEEPVKTSVSNGMNAPTR